MNLSNNEKIKVLSEMSLFKDSGLSDSGQNVIPDVTEEI